MKTQIKRKDLDKKYLLYCRKSTEGEDRQILSLSAQYRELTEYAKEKNLKIVGVYKESKSAYKPGREEFNNMISKISNGEANAILVWHKNRLARNAVDGGMIIHLLDTKKLVEIRTPSSISIDNANDKFMLQIDFAMSKKYSDDNSDVVKRGNREKFEQGWWPGLAKIGYVNKTDPITKSTYIDIDKDRFHLIKDAMKLIIDGSHTPIEALNKLNNEWKFRTIVRAKTGNRPLSKSAWYRILTDEYYYGLMVRVEGIKMGKHKPMLTEEDFNKLQQRLGKPRRTHATNKEFPYKKLLTCGECNGSITCQEKHQIICSNCKKKFAQTKKRTKCPKCNLKILEMDNPTLLHYTYYSCTKKVHPNCSQGSIEIDKIEQKIDTTLCEYEIPEEFKNWAIDHLNEVNDQEEEQDTRVFKQLQDRFDQNKQSLRNLIRLRISRDNSRLDIERQQMYDEQEKELLQEQKEITEQLNKVNERQKQWIELSKETFEFACYARYWFDKGGIDKKTYILSKLGKNLKVMDKKILIDEHKPFYLVKKAKKEMLEKVGSLEPTKKIGNSNKLEYSELASSIMRR